jgi:ribonuclease HII
MIGVDEVGRGCLAGPLLVVAARVIGELPPGLKDSKLLSRQQRVKILDLLSICCNFGEGWVKCSEIDKLGLSRALKLGARRALQDLKAGGDEEIILDGSFNYLPRKFKNSEAVIGADDSMPLVSAASIHAKVTRDRYMFELAKRHPGYFFENHVGYGTKAHMLALKQLGALKYVHRQSFMPIANLNGVWIIKTTEQGVKAEAAVAGLLAQHGFELIDRNWKTKVCEIDLVMQKARIMYFVEVKYRRQAAQGDGLEYIGPQKLKRMNFAASVWCQNFNWDGDYRLMAAAVSGDNCENIQLIEIDWA